MTSIINLKEQFTVNNKEFYIKLIHCDIIEQYVDILRSDFYSEFLDFKFNRDISKEDLISSMNNKAEQYTKSNGSIKEYRFIVLNNKEQIVAGFTLYMSEKHIELAYFVVPEYQRQGIAFNMLSRIIDKLSNIGYADKTLIANVQYNNIKSLNLLQKLQFVKYKKYRGKFGTNIKLIRHIREK